MNSELMNIENIDPIIVQYLIDKMTAKIEKRRNSQRDRGNRWYEKHKKVNKDYLNDNNEVVHYTRGGRPRKVLNVVLEIIPLIKV